MITLPSTLGIILLALTYRYGRAGLKRLAGMRLRAGWLAVTACGLQIVGILGHGWRLELLPLSAAFLVVFCWLNRRYAGIPLAAAGIMLNLLVMGVNGGRMPISPATFGSISHLMAPTGTALPFTKDRILTNEQATLAWLGDRLLLPGPRGPIAAWSIGDVLMLAGIVWLLWHLMKGSEDDERTIWATAAPSGAGAADLRGR